VGEEIIMQSDLNAALSMIAAQNPKLNVNDPNVRLEVLNNLIDNKLMITKAIEDSIEVTDEEVDRYLDYWIQEEVRKYGSEKRLEDVYGISISRLKFDYRDDIKKRLLAQRLQQQKFSSVVVSQKEVSDFYNIYRDSLPPIPEQVDIYHILKNVESNASTKNEIYELAKRVRDSIIAGGDFKEFARLYSGDAGTKNEGGELGWFDKGKLYPDFEKAAFALQIGEVSMPVETPFGFHVIQTLDKNKDAVKTRHILFKLGQSSEDVDKVKNLLADLKKRAGSGEDFEELARKNSDDKDTKGFGGYLGRFQIGEIPTPAIKDLPEGGISDPALFKSEGGKTSYHIVYKKEIIKPHQASLESDYKYIERLALMYKQQKELEKYLKELRDEIYWTIKD
jgi:peptidyl-prolyl cis-trans isomerase SurA